MARAAQYTVKKLVAFSPAEAELLAMLAEQRNVTVSDVIREAVRLLAKKEGGLRREVVARRLGKLVAAASLGAERDAVKRDVDGVLAFLSDQRDAGPGARALGNMDSAKLFGD